MSWQCTWRCIWQHLPGWWSFHKLPNGYVRMCAPNCFERGVVLTQGLVGHLLPTEKSFFERCPESVPQRHSVRLPSTKRYCGDTRRSRPGATDVNSTGHVRRRQLVCTGQRHASARGIAHQLHHVYLSRLDLPDHAAADAGYFAYEGTFGICPGKLAYMYPGRNALTNFPPYIDSFGVGLPDVLSGFLDIFAMAWKAQAPAPSSPTTTL